MSNEEDQLLSVPGSRLNSMTLSQCEILECDEYGHIVIDCLYWITPSDTLCMSPQITTQHRLHNRLTSTTIMRSGTDAEGLDHNPSLQIPQQRLP